MFVDNVASLAQSVHSFMDAPEYWRDAIGNRPKYFVHVESEGRHLFGLSKYCAFDAISLEDYVVSHRHTTSGGVTQKHISRLCGRPWTPLAANPTEVRKAFEPWFTEIVAGRVGLTEIHILSVSDVAPRPTKARVVSPEELQRRLKRQLEVGRVGEEIAMQYELARLRALGVRRPADHVQQVSLVNAAAGFDIRSSCASDIRHIEVKATTAFGSPFFISANEVQTLQKLGSTAYIYIVHVTDLAKCAGSVVKEMGNPFSSGDAIALSPVIYQATLAA